MNVEREVIVDLLPLYAAGELSPQSRRLVEEHLAHDASLRRLAEALKTTNGEPHMDTGLKALDRELDTLLDISLPGSDPAELEKRSFSRTRLLNGLRSALIGAAIFVTLSIFTFWVDGNSVTMLLQLFPTVVRNLALAAVLLWVLAFFLEIIWNLLSDLFGTFTKK